MTIYYICVIVLLLADLWPSAAESSSDLTCTSAKFLNGSVQFQLSHRPSSSSCTTCWEDQNKTVMARNSVFYKEFVHSLTDDSIILTDCRPLRYILECSAMRQEFDCTVNCSSHLDPTSPSSNSTHPDKPKWKPIVAVVLLLPFIVVTLWCFHKKKCSVMSSTAASYTPAQQTV